MKIMSMIRVILVVTLVVGVFAPFTFLKYQPQIDTKEAVADVDTSSVDTVIEIAKPVRVDTKPKVIEKPLHKIELPNFAEIRDIPTKKKAFFAFIRPAIDAKNKQLEEERTRLEYWHEQISLGIGVTEAEQVLLQDLIKAYRISEDASNLQQINDLLERVDIIPTSLVLVQAANESAWGTSRFARIGLNFFGIWCYRQGCGMVPGGRNTGARHEVAAFQSVDAAVSGYFNNINKHNAYHVFRIIRAELRAQDQPLYPEILATGLLPYSERGSQYVLDITDMLRHNQRYF